MVLVVCLKYGMYEPMLKWIKGVWMAASPRPKVPWSISTTGLGLGSLLWRLLEARSEEAVKDSSCREVGLISFLGKGENVTGMSQRCCEVEVGTIERMTTKQQHDRLYVCRLKRALVNSQ
jgi:hypothetical protein